MLGNILTAFGVMVFFGFLFLRSCEPIALWTIDSMDLIAYNVKNIKLEYLNIPTYYLDFEKIV